MLDSAKKQGRFKMEFSIKINWFVNQTKEFANWQECWIEYVAQSNH